MKTPTAEPQAPKPAETFDIGTWISILIGIAGLVKLGIVVARHI